MKFSRKSRKLRARSFRRVRNKVKGVSSFNIDWGSKKVRGKPKTKGESKRIGGIQEGRRCSEN